MKPVRRAVIDVGTNSVKLLVAEVAGSLVQPILEESQQTRLGAGLYQTRYLQPGRITQTADAVARFAQTACQQQARSIRVIATSAARDAINAESLIQAIEEASRLRVEIISGEQEADWVFQGVGTDPRLTGASLLLLDVGGGRTEFIVGHKGQAHFRASYPLGTVRLLEKLAPGDPPREEDLAACRQWLREFLQKEVQPRLAPELRESSLGPIDERLELIGTGGTTTILARMEKELEDFDREQIEAVHLSRDRLRWHVDRLWRLPLAERKRLIGLPPNRADVILMGAAIYEAILEQFALEELRVSTRGLRFAAVMMVGPSENEEGRTRVLPLRNELGELG